MRSRLLMVLYPRSQVGFLSELKGDHHSAYKAYSAAYQLLGESKLTEQSASEARLVAGLLSFKVCRLAFKLNLPRDAVQQFRQLGEQWRTVPGAAGLTWEQAAWQSDMAAAFGRLFCDAVSGGQVALQTQHPGIYFQLAAEHAISRRKLAESLCSAVTAYPSPDPLAGQATTEFYGQRAWRAGRTGEPDPARERAGLEALQWRERRVRHSAGILELLSRAVEQFRQHGCPRMAARLGLQAGEELLAGQEYSAALASLLPGLPACRAQGWPTITYTNLSTALKCAFLSCALPTYLQLCLELCGLPGRAAIWLPGEQKRVWANLLLVLEQGRPPLPEPSLTGKAERAGVGLASKQWTGLLGSSQTTQLELDMTGVEAGLVARVSLPPAARADHPVPVTLSLTNRGWGAVTVRAARCQLTAGQAWDWTGPPEEVQGGAERVWQFSWAGPGVAGTKLGVTEVSVLVGGRESLQVRLVCRNGSGSDVCQLEPRPAEVCLDTAVQLPALVGEWCRLDLTLTSGETETATGLELTCQLEEQGDPLVADTTVLATSPVRPAGTPPSHQPLVLARLEKLEAGAGAGAELWVRCSTPGERGLGLVLSYSLAGQPARLTTVFRLPAVPPFSFAARFLTERLEETDGAGTAEPFCVECMLTSLGPHALTISAAAVEPSGPVTLAGSVPPGSLALLPGASVSRLFSLLAPTERMLPQLDSQTVAPGRLVLSWSRQADHTLNQTVFDLPTLKLSRAALYVECQLPPFGLLRAALQADYKFYNRGQDIMEFQVTTEPSDSFMFSGPKQTQVKIFPRDCYTLSLVFYPLVCGRAPLPRMRLTSQENGAAQETLDRLLPSSLVVMPRQRLAEKQFRLDLDQMSLTQPVVIENLPYNYNVKKG